MSTSDPRFSFEGASAATLRGLAERLRSGQLALPLNTFSLSRDGGCPRALATDLQRLSEEGLSAAHLALLLETAAHVAEAEMRQAAAVQLVWTGPEHAVSHSRDTAVVVDELFARATESVLVSTFVIQHGQQVFARLISRMDELPGVNVRLFLHIARGWSDTRTDEAILGEFAEGLGAQWPGSRRPAVYFDPRSLTLDASSRASWHAKCVLVDDRVSFVTSANFTEWAQMRNVEAGVLVKDAHFTRQLRAQFDTLVQSGLVRRLPGW